MNRQKDRIYIDKWLELKPYERQIVTDSYYLKLSNEVKQAIVSSNKLLVFQIYLDRAQINSLCCFLTSYFEDLISGTNIWNTFVRYHTELYNKPLPFFDTEEYYPEELNQQDVCFLIWYFMNTIQQEKFIAPSNDFIFDAAAKVMDVLDAVWEYAPENDLLKTFYTFDEKETSFYAARHFIDTILLNTYLFYPDAKIALMASELETIEKYGDDKNIFAFLNENRDLFVHQTRTRILGLTGKEWASALLGEQHPMFADFRSVSKKISGYFMYKGQDEVDVFLKHIASGKRFSLTKKSFDQYEEFKEVDSIVFIGIVRWRDEWWFSGVYFHSSFDADLVLDEKNSIESRKAVDFLDHQEQNVEEILEMYLTVFKNINNGLQVAFITKDKINDFIKQYMEQYNNMLELPEKDKIEATQRAKTSGFFGGEESISKFSDGSDSCLVFLNPNSGVEIALEVNSAFPLPNNPYFNEEESEEHILRLLMNEAISKELAMYCIDHCQAKLPFFAQDEGKLFLADIDFLLRFWKRDAYFTQPTISFTGQP